MSHTWTIYKRELKAYLISPIPYVFVVLFVVLLALFFFFLNDGQFFVVGKATLEAGFFEWLPWMLVFLVPALSMRLWSDETYSGTIELLMTLPTRVASVVLGKFLAAWTLLGVALLLTAPIPITVASLGDLDWGPVFGGYLGSILLGGALLAVGTWISTFTRHQMVAFLLTLVIGFGLIIVQYIAGPALQVISLRVRYDAMNRGVIDLRDLVYFLSIIGLFLYLNIQSVENRRVR